MILSEFIEATSRLETYYEKEYTDEQRKIMFEEVKNMPLEKYRKTLANCLRTCKFMPKLADILKASSEIDNANYENKKEYEYCKICGGRGMINYKKILQENNYEYDFFCRCICKNGENFSKKIPTFEELGIQPGDRLVMNFE